MKEDKKTMSLRFYNNYISEIAVNPNHKYREDLQSLINAQWDNTTTVYKIKEETPFRDFKFCEIEARLNHVIDEVTTGRKSGDDFKKIIFRSLEHVTQEGRYYNFDNNYWITTFNDEYNSVVKSIIVRRCNNFAKYVSPTSGAIISIPCVLDYTASSPSPQVSGDIITPNNHVVMIIQGNEKTIQWKVNQRFLFNQRPYKITGYNNYMQNNYVDKDTPLLYFDLFLDEIHSDDDLENNVASSLQYVYTINLLDNNFEQIKGYKGSLQAEVKCNGEIVDRDLVWCSLDSDSTIDDEGNFELTGDVGSVAQIKVSLKENPLVSDTIDISIVDEAAKQYSIVVVPDIVQIKQHETKDFSAVVYLDGEKTENKVNVTLSGVTDDYYRFIENGNNQYALQCLYPSTTPLDITFSFADVVLKKQIKLLPLF